MFTERQTLCLLTFAHAIQQALAEMRRLCYEDARARAISTYLGILLDRQADYNSSLARWHNTGEKMASTFGRHAVGMVWDFAELGPFGGVRGADGALAWIVNFIAATSGSRFGYSLARLRGGIAIR